MNRLGIQTASFSNPQPNSPFFNLVTEFEVSDIISNLDAKKSADAYGISIKLVKLIKDAIVGLLT